MNIIVCVKPVPDPEKYNLLTIDPETKRLVREGIPSVINPADRNALETALKIREERGGTVTVVSMAPLFSQDRIRECLALGADAAFLISDPAFSGADTLATSYTLAKAIEKTIEKTGIRPDLILAGNESADGATSHVPSQLGEWLGLPHIANVAEILFEDDTVRIKRKIENGNIEYEAALPLLLAIARGSNKPRLLSAMGIIKAKNTPLTVFARADLEVEESLIGLAGSPTKAGELFVPAVERDTVEISGTAEEIARQIYSVIKKAGNAV